MIQLTNVDDEPMLVNIRTITYIKPYYSDTNKMTGSYIMFDNDRSVYVKQNVEYISQLIKEQR